MNTDAMLELNADDFFCCISLGYMENTRAIMEASKRLEKGLVTCLNSSPLF